MHVRLELNSTVKPVRDTCCEDIEKQILAVFALLDGPEIFDWGVASLWCQVGKRVLASAL